MTLAKGESMLLNLHVKNLALIEEAEVDFTEGLNILTGETGAGKSIIIGSVILALGEKVSRDMLRNSEKDALVELIFYERNQKVLDKLEEMDIFPEDGQIVLTRKITKGRSICRINSETVSAAQMRKAASLLIDIHGQHESQSLLAAKNHLKYLDDFAGETLWEQKETLGQLYHIYTQQKAELEAFSLDVREQQRELELLQYEVAEIEEASLKTGEDEQLESDYRRLANGKKILEATGAAHDLMSGSRENASDAIGAALRELLYVSSYDGRLAELSGQLQEIDDLVNDFNRDLADYLEESEFSDETFEQISLRLDLINRLKEKYGNSIEAILAQKEEKEARIEKIMNYDVYREKLRAQLQQTTEKLDHISRKISSMRKMAAKEMTKQIRAVLADLNFLDVKFEMEFKQLRHFTANGMDEGRFLISTNPGEPMKYLDKVASGGELSRIMLALKTVLADRDETGTLIFDEIDTGISGRTAQMAAEKMQLISDTHQIICITHLPQIAAMADTHFLIEKNTSDNQTSTQIRVLDEAAGIRELARMLGGVKITDTVMESAKEMKEMADAVKTSRVK